MTSITITEDLAEQIFHDDLPDGMRDLTVLETLDWVDNGKYSNGGCIFRSGDKTYLLSVSRSGSYYDGYDFQYDTDCTEVEQVEIVIKSWKPKLPSQIKV
jgi:hypothetical protein